MSAPESTTFSSHSFSALNQHIETTFASFKKITRKHALFHTVFFLVAFLELITLSLFFPFFTQTTLFAFTLAALFFTTFSYLLLRFYFQAKKPAQLLALKETYIEQSAYFCPYPSTEPDYFFHLIAANQSLLDQLADQEYNYYPLPASFPTLRQLMQKFSAWLHWKDLHQIRELLLFSIIQYHISLVKQAPTDPKAHAFLATAYIHLSNLYLDPRKQAKEPLWISPEYHLEPMQKKCEQAIGRAIEELKIFNTYTPDDPWGYLQMAQLYHVLERKEEEIQAYETVLSLTPYDPSLLLTLGALYFTQGQSAEALRLYERLFTIDPDKAETLISYYNASFDEMF